MKKSRHGHSNNGQESWGRDSGARDLSPDLHRPNSSGTSQMTENETGGIMDQLQATPPLSMRSDVVELSQRLQRSEHGRHVLEQQLREMAQERDRMHRQLDSMAATNESRITEMHCVIVELSKKLKTKEDAVIAEEPEGSVSELSFQEGSVYNSDMEEVLAAESQTEPLDTKLEQPHRQESFNESQKSFPNILPAPNFLPDSGSLNRIDVLQDEVLHLRAQVALLESQMAANKDTREAPTAAVEDPSITATAAVSSPPANTSTPTRADCSDVVFPATNGRVPVVTASAGVAVVPKMAERVKLKRTNDGDYITGPDIATTGVCTTEMAEHLVADLCQNVLASPGDVTQLQLEMKQMQRRIEYLKVQNTILSLTISESKQHCEHLYLLCGKYESNAIALQQALNYSDRAIEAYDVMLALFESRLDIVQNNPGGVKNKEDAETVARHLLTHLDDSESNVQSNSLGPWQDAILLYSSERSKEAGVSMWTKEDDFRLRSHISKLKGHRASVQSTIVTLESPFYVEGTVNGGGGGGGSSASGGSSSIISPCSASSKRMDLETAVLMQELMNMTQEVTLFKARAEKAEQEKRVSEEHLKALQEALLQVQSQMNDMGVSAGGGCGGGVGMVPLRDRGIYSDGGEQTAEIERELVDALARESRLKARLQGLAGSVEAATKSSKEKYTQLQELKQANQTLNSSLDKCKRKYEAKVKRLEGQLHDLSIRWGGGGGGGDVTANKGCSLPSPNRASGSSRRTREPHQQQQQQNNQMTSSMTLCKTQQQSVPETTL